MTGSVPSSNASGIGVDPPNNPYFIDDIPDGGIELLPHDQNEQDPMLLLSAQLRNNLYVTSNSEFRTNVPETVYKDFIVRANQWKEYVDLCGWKNLNQSDQTTAKIVANSIKEGYFSLGRVGQEEKCMFGLEQIAVHLRDVISMETFFSSLLV